MAIRKLGTIVEWRDGQHSQRENFLFDLMNARIGSESVPVPCPSPDLDEVARQDRTNYRGCSLWIFKGHVYEITGASHQSYSKEQLQLLISEYYDREMRRFERLNTLYKSGAAQKDLGSRERIPERVRIEVWRRDGGKCARCGSREKLEYDHIVPQSKGGSSTSRNIELLCEKCNRGKADRVG